MKIGNFGAFRGVVGTPYSYATLKSEDGTEIKIEHCISEELFCALEQQILAEAQRKLGIAAKETNLLPQVVEAEQADDCPF